MAQSKQPSKDPVAVDNLAHAAELLERTDVWREALDVLRGEYVDAIVSSKPVQTAQRENAYYMIQAIDGLSQQLQAFIVDKKFRDAHVRTNVDRK